ncbi:MAG: T9SS type A sorting domain-containing protein [Bacteroidia bacterium]
MKKISIILLTVYCLFSFDKVNAQWEHVRSFTGGRARCFTNDNNTIYAGVYNYGLVKSVDAGDHWSFVNDSINTLFNQINGVFSISAEANRLLCFTSYGHFALSLDSGINWQDLSSSLPWVVTQDAKIYKGKIFATDYYKVYVSDNDCISWSADSLTGYDPKRFEISDNRIFLVSEISSSLYASVDTGVTWLNLGSTGVTSYRSFSAKGDTLAIVTPSLLRISTDLGANWITVYTQPFNNYSFPVVYFDNDTLYFINNDSIFNSYNLGATWNFLAYKGGLRATSIVKTGNNFLIGSYNHAFVLFNPVSNTLVKKAKGIFGVNVSDIKAKGDSLIVIDGDLYYHSEDNGANWSYSIPFNKDDPYNPGGFIDYDTTGVYTCYYDKVLRTTDWGVTWVPFDTVPYSVNRILCYQGKIFYATDSGVYMRPSQGPATVKYGSLNSPVYGLAANKNRIFATDEYYVYTADIDTNPQWVITINGLPNSNHFYFATASDTAVFILGNKGVYRCYPPDTTWSYTGLFQKGVFDLTCFHNDAFATSSLNGVTILRNDTGSVWNPINFGLDDYKPWQVAAQDSFIFCGGNWHGLYKRLRDQVQYPAGINENNSADDFYFSIYPNPASDVMQITGNVQSVNAKLNLIDITGRICFTKTVSSKGNFSFNINANNFADGIYFLNMFDGKRKYSGKVLIQH